MSDLKAALLGAVVGGMISTGATWIQGSMAKEKDLATEKRQKLEVLLENAIKLNRCLFLKLSITKNEDECEKDGTSFRLLTLQTLYFPEMRAEVAAYVGRINSVEASVAKCSGLGGTSDEQLKYLKCIKMILNDPVGGEELQNLATKAEAVSKGLR